MASGEFRGPTVHSMLRDLRLEKSGCCAFSLVQRVCMLLTEPSYFDSEMIFQASDPSSAYGVEIRVCGVRLARPIWESAVLRAHDWNVHLLLELSDSPPSSLSSFS